MRQGSAILAGSVLLDSATEHFRGGWHDRRMYAAPLTAASSLAASGMPAERTGHAIALAVGAAGLAFHLRNVLRRPGRLCWNNLFYAAPLGAPGALIISGGLGLFAAELEDAQTRPFDARWVAGFAGAALVGEAVEVWLLHFRGAFHDPFMYLPVTIPPAAGAALLWRAAGGEPTELAKPLLKATSALGFVGTGFHIYGVSRNMGGWRNWRQNALAGPPVPAPISFTGLAMAGQAALELLDRTNAKEAAA